MTIIQVLFLLLFLHCIMHDLKCNLWSLETTFKRLQWRASVRLQFSCILWFPLPLPFTPTNWGPWKATQPHDHTWRSMGAGHRHFLWVEILPWKVLVPGIGKLPLSSAVLCYLGSILIWLYSNWHLDYIFIEKGNFKAVINENKNNTWQDHLPICNSIQDLLLEATA